MFGDIYRDKRVLVTGHTGFKGSWLSLWLQQLGAKVTGFSLPALPSQPNHYSLLSLDAGSHQDRRGDITDLAGLKELMAEVQPELVMHLAAQPLVRLSYSDPVGTFAANVMGTVNVLEACRGVSGLRGVVNVTSDKCYENTGKAGGYVESDAMGGHDPYSASKGCAELVAASFRRAFANGEQALPPVASVRAGNVVGGGDWAADRLIADAARAVAAGETLTIRRPDAVRPWQHVLEPLSGYLLVGQRLLAGGAAAEGVNTGWNFGPPPESTLTVGEVLARLQAHLPINYECPPQEGLLHEATLLTLDSSKAARELAWQPVWDAGTMLRHTAEWYRAFIDTETVLSAVQLAAYVADARRQGLAWAS